MSMMEGMLSDDELEQLSDAQGADAARMFLEQMIAHHQGAIDMARVQLARGSDPGLRRMAGEIIAAQQREIAELNAYLNRTGGR